MEEMSVSEVSAVSGGDAWTNLALVGGAVAAGIGGVFVAPAVAGSVIFAAGAYVAGFGAGTVLRMRLF